MCEEHEAKREEGYITVIGIDESKTPGPSGNALIQPETAHRTGSVLHVKPNVWPMLFPDTEIPEKGVIFCGEAYVQHLVDTVRVEGE